ncbi:YbjQ family protein [Primorskyibacter aestuariivivens]|uniref:YbjQ family protein n=1 Tax=Primorskyibacter aestuariivivens TaxID=1888912 RepID=UPI0023019C26|nr:YbjQ family protein [Primorskyibacter aestuariivivens]MDA7427481.1 YbjQ family protein [Primorskyibacter aestuariivivens]
MARLRGEETPQIMEHREHNAEIEEILITTEMQPDIAIRERITIVTAECAYGMNVFKDIFASVRNVFGGRSEAIQKTMRDARETVLFELKREAHAVGANAVVGVDLDYTQIGDSGWNMVMLIASGTAVVVDQ